MTATTREVITAETRDGMTITQEVFDDIIASYALVSEIPVVPTPPDLSGFVTSSEVETLVGTAVDTAVPPAVSSAVATAVEGLASETYVNNAVSTATTDMATETWTIQQVGTMTSTLATTDQLNYVKTQVGLVPVGFLIFNNGTDPSTIWADTTWTNLGTSVLTGYTAYQRAS